MDIVAKHPRGVGVVFVGDSITEFWPEKSPKFFDENQFIGRGISGQVTHQILLRFRDDVINLKPEIVVILAGTNDLAQNSGEVSLQIVANNIFTMAEVASYHGASVILCSLLPASDYPWRSGLDPISKIAELNKMISDYAFKHEHQYVDYYSAMVDEKGGLRVPDFTSAEDLVHPNKAGYVIMEELIKVAIDSERKSRVTTELVLLETE